LGFENSEKVNNCSIIIWST